MKVTLKDNRTAWKTLLNSEAGAKLIQWLKYTYDGEVIAVPDNPNVTYFRLGQRDVVKLLEGIMENEDNA